MAASLDHVLPLLRDQHAHVMNELKDEEDGVKEIEGGNQQWLDELKESIAEQT